MLRKARAMGDVIIVMSVGLALCLVILYVDRRDNW